MRTTTTTRVQVGDRIRLTRAFLRSTGQLTGGEGHSRWTVRACPCRMCATGEWVLTDERAQAGFYTDDEIRAEPYLAWRHLNAGNVERAK